VQIFGFPLFCGIGAFARLQENKADIKKPIAATKTQTTNLMVNPSAENVSSKPFMTSA